MLYLKGARKSDAISVLKNVAFPTSWLFFIWFTLPKQKSPQDATEVEVQTITWMNWMWFLLCLKILVFFGKKLRNCIEIHNFLKKKKSSSLENAQGVEIIVWLLNQLGKIAFPSKTYFKGLKHSGYISLSLSLSWAFWKYFHKRQERKIS